MSDAITHIANLHHRLVEVVRGLSPTLLATRPTPEVWSPAEYVYLLRDVHMTYTLRLYRTRTEYIPTLTPV